MTAIHPVSGKPMKWGRNLPPPTAKRGLALSDFLQAGWAPPVPVPARPDWAAAAIAGLEDIDGNDQYGDCCFAGIMHLICILIGNTGATLPFPSRAQALALYTAVTGFDPNDPSTDVGGDLPTVMDYVKAHGAYEDGSFKLTGYVSVDASNPDEVRAADYIFGGTYRGVMLPQGWTNPMPSKSGFVWDVAGDPDSSQGHCITGYGDNKQGGFVDTWGLFGTVTEAADAKYFTTAGSGEVHAILWPQWIDQAKQRAPNGMNWDALQSAMAAF